MLTIQIPHIAIQKVSNGYVIQWKKKKEALVSSEKTQIVSAIAPDDETLIDIIGIASRDIEELC
jgi:hypothetical protein